MHQLIRKLKSRKKSMDESVKKKCYEEAHGLIKIWNVNIDVTNVLTILKEN